MMYCNKCGKPLAEDARFCPECRKELEQMLAEDKKIQRIKMRPVIWIGIGVTVLLAAIGCLVASGVLDGLFAPKQESVKPDRPEETVVWVRTESRSLDANGKVKARTVYRFDDNGFCVRQTKLNGEGEMTEDTVFTCDEAGRHIQAVTTYGADNALVLKQLVEKWTYDEHGNKTWYDCRRVFDSPVDMVSIKQEIYGYTRKYGRWMWRDTEQYTGNVTGQQEPNLERKFIGSTKYEGNTMTARWMRGDGSVAYYMVYTYDENGNTLKEERLDENQKLRYTTTYEWKDGKVTGVRTTDENGKLTGSVERTYDNNGNLVRIVDRNGDGEITSETQLFYARADKIPEENKEK